MGVLLAGTFAQGADRWTEGTLDAVLDTRELAPGLLTGQSLFGGETVQNVPVTESPMGSPVAVSPALPILAPEHAAVVIDHLEEQLEPFVSRRAALPARTSKVSPARRPRSAAASWTPLRRRRTRKDSWQRLPRGNTSSRSLPKRSSGTRRRRSRC